MFPLIAHCHRLCDWTTSLQKKYSLPNCGGHILKNGPLHSTPQTPLSHGDCGAFGASDSLSSSFHPQANGQSDRIKQDLKSVLRCVSARHPASWCTHLSWVEYGHNSLFLSTTGTSPFMVAYGFQPPLFSHQE